MLAYSKEIICAGGVYLWRVTVSETACNLRRITLSKPEKSYRASRHCSNPQYTHGIKYPARNRARGLSILRLRGLLLSNWRLFLQRKASLTVRTFVNTITVSMLSTEWDIVRVTNSRCYQILQYFSFQSRSNYLKAKFSFWINKERDILIFF